MIYIEEIFKKYSRKENKPLVILLPQKHYTGVSLPHDLRTVGKGIHAFKHVRVFTS